MRQLDMSVGRHDPWFAKIEPREKSFLNDVYPPSHALLVLDSLLSGTYSSPFEHATQPPLFEITLSLDVTLRLLLLCLRLAFGWKKLRH